MTPRAGMLALSCVILVACLGAEMFVLFVGYPTGAPEIVVGRVLGTLDAAAMLVLNYHYGSSAGSARKSEILAQQDAQDHQHG